MSPLEAISDERARAVAVEVAARPEYARFAIPDAVPVDAFSRWLTGLLRWFDALFVESPVLWGALVFGLLALALALLAHVIWSIRLAMRTSALPPAPARGPGARRLDLEAQDLADARRFLEAAHAMHLACIERLVQGRGLELHRHDPNATLRQRLAAARLDAAERGEFVRLLDWLEQRWFRDPTPAPRDAELFEGWRALHARLAGAAP